LEEYEAMSVSSVELEPKSPRDLPAHRCINFRHGSAGAYHWEFDKGRKSLSVGVNEPLTVDDGDVLIRAAVDGVGLAFALEEHVATQLASGTLVRGLDDWRPPFAGCFLYYPSRRQQPPALSALIETVRL
jgi:DNA-binding transcriptional LysR family regulator